MIGSYGGGDGAVATSRTWQLLPFRSPRVDEFRSPAMPLQRLGGPSDSLEPEWYWSAASLEKHASTPFRHNPSHHPTPHIRV